METENKQTIKFIDSTPDKEYPIRILLAYLLASKVKFSDNSADLPINNLMLVIMNKANEERQVLLEEAISILRKNMSSNPERTVYVPTPLPNIEEILNVPEPVTRTTTSGGTTISYLPCSSTKITEYALYSSFIFLKESNTWIPEVIYKVAYNLFKTEDMICIPSKNFKKDGVTYNTTETDLYIHLLMDFVVDDNCYSSALMFRKIDLKIEYVVLNLDDYNKLKLKGCV